MSDDLNSLIREIVAPRPPSTCIWIADGRMCGKPADPQRLGMCADHWREACAMPPPPPAHRIEWTTPDDESVVLVVAHRTAEVLDVIEDRPGGLSRPDLLAVAAECHEEIAELVREVEEPEPERRECDYCGGAADGNYCSASCRAADESDRG